MNKLISLILHKNTVLIAICTILPFLLIEGFTGIPMNKTIGFYLCLLICMIILGTAVWKRKTPFSFKNMAFLLTHAGFFLTLLFSSLSSFEFQRLHVRAFSEIPENIAITEDHQMFLLPFQITLQNFEAEFYDNHQPKSYKAEIILTDGDTKKQHLLQVNRPARFMGYDIYLSSYDRTHPDRVDYVILLVIYDPWVLAKYIGIIMLILGLLLYICTLNFAKNRMVLPGVLLFGLIFSYLVFAPYWFFGKNLVPALQSNWFFPHIAVYMFAYGSLAVACLLAIYTLFNRSRTGGARSLSPSASLRINSVEVCFAGADLQSVPKKGEKFFAPKGIQIATDFSLKLGTMLMGIGLLFGALWAKTAWGNFWSFDLKETWAAIAWFAFMGVLHFKHAYENRRKTLSILIIAAFLLLQMCWFGVNYLPEFLQSLHRY